MEIWFKDGADFVSTDSQQGTKTVVKFKFAALNKSQTTLRIKNTKVKIKVFAGHVKTVRIDFFFFFM